VRRVLDTIATVAMIAASVWVIWAIVHQGKGAGLPAVPPVVDAPSAPVSLDGSFQQGDPNAPAAILVFSDFECPFCGRFAREVLPVLQNKYVKSGRALLAFRQAPNGKNHPLALGAAGASICAGRQGKFWEMHDLLFRNQASLGEQSLQSRAEALGINMPMYRDCRASEAGERIIADTAQARELGVTATPTIMLGTVQSDGRVLVGVVLKGAMPLRTFEESLDATIVSGRTAK